MFPPDVSPAGFCDTRTFPPSFLCCYMRIDGALDSGITFSMVKECSKHQIRRTLVLSLIGLNNTSNKGQVSRSLSSQLPKKQLRTSTSKCHSKRSVCHSKESVCDNAIHRILLFLCSLSKKNMCVNYFYSPG